MEKKNGAGDGDRTHDIHLGKVQKLQLIQCNGGLTDSQIAAIYSDFENAIIEDFNLWMVVGSCWMRAAKNHPFSDKTARLMIETHGWEF
jgi:hypothetical protein